MAGVSLFEAHEKVRWAWKHYESLWSEIDPLQKRDDHRIVAEVNPDKGEYVFHVFDLPTPNPDWGLLIGDCLHNARAALDYLMVRLYALRTGIEPRGIGTIQFPVYDSLDRFTNSPSVQNFRKRPALSVDLARIEELQPLNAHNPAVWVKGDPLSPGGRHAPVPEALLRLSRLDNIDKHRVIHAALLSGAVQLGRPPFPSEFRLIGEGRTFDSLENGAEIGRWRFETPLPFAWEPPEVDVKRYFPIEVSLDQPLPPKAVLKELPFCLWGVEQVLAIFEPVFTDGQPPLPVTAIQ